MFLSRGKLIVFVTVLFFSWGSIPAFADRVDDLSRRVEELENQQQDYLIQATDRKNEVNSFIKDHLTLGVLQPKPNLLRLRMRWV